MASGQDLKATIEDSDKNYKYNIGKHSVNNWNSKCVKALTLLKMYNLFVHKRDVTWRRIDGKKSPF